MTSKRGISGLALLLVVSSGLIATPGAATASSTPGGLQTLGQAGWQVQTTSPTTTWTTGTGATQRAADISDARFDPAGWLRVAPDDGGAVGTEVEALVQNGICPDDAALQPINQRNGDPRSVYYSNNMQSCFGPPATNAGANTNPLFNVPWWFRTTFAGSFQDNTRLVINGIVGQADVWVNGTEVATQATVEGAYASYTFDVSDLLHSGTNAIAFEVFPDNPSTMLTLDDVDWNQIPPDNNTGIQFPVQLHSSGSFGVTNSYVTQNDSPDMSSAALTVHADATNNTGSAKKTTVRAVISPPGGSPPIVVEKNVTVAAGATQTVTFDPVVIRHPRLWWPYQMGGQPLYTLRTSVGGDVAAPVVFGIRTVTSYLTAASAQAAQGVRVFEINGVPFEVRGGGWAENLFLHYSAADLDNQITLVKSMGLNTIRTEGKEMPQDFYESMDREGIMLDPGFQCCDKWQPSSSGRGVTAQDFHIMYASSLEIGKRLRDHPSVTSFGWSDNTPINEQEVASIQGFAQAGFQEPLLSSAEYKASGILGPAGEKEGPYDWEPPDYWFDTTHSSNSGVDTDSSQTNVGGSWGFDSEQGSGDTVPTTDSLDRFMSPADQATLWQQPDAHQYHTNYESTAGQHNGYSFGTLYNLDTAIQGRYGSWDSLQQYVQQAQVQNYESTRAQFEAYLDHWNNYPTPSTGTIYWQMNKGWPSLLWNLYNNDYDEAGAYFGAKKANENLHVLYAPDDGTVTVDNLTGVTQPGLTVEAQVRDLSGKVLDTRTSHGFSLPTQGVVNRILTPRTPAANVYFVELVLRQGGKVVDRNVYWRSPQSDVVDWAATEGSPQANNGEPLSQYMDMSALQSLPSTNLSVSASTSARPDADGKLVTTITVANPSSNKAVGFFTRADVRRGTANGVPQSGDNEVLPVDWSDNDITLWPGQSETLTATYGADQLKGATPLVTLGGWNVPSRTVVAGHNHAPAAPGFGTANGHPLVTGTATAGPGAPFHSPDTSRHGATGPAWTIGSATSAAFTQGDAADAYTITLTDSGRGPTDGSTPVTVTDVLDPGAGLVSLAGDGWTCDTSNAPTLTCTRADVLAPGHSYPPLTLTEKLGARAGFGTQDSNAGPHVTNSVAVVGGAPDLPAASIARETPVAGVPSLTADNAVDGAFRQGDASDRYEITVINQGGAATTGAPIVAKVTPGAGETITALYGSGWTCDLASCSRSDALQGNNGEAPPITVVVSVAATAPASSTETVVVSGGGATASASVATATTIQPVTPVAPTGSLTVTSHAGSLAQSDQADPITLTVSNPATAGPGTGPVTVVDSPPAGLVPVRIGGPGWTCSLAPATLPGAVNTFAQSPSCTRSDTLAPGASYPPITMAVAVANNTQPQVTNVATVNGVSSSAAITVTQRPRLAVTGVPVAGGIRYAPFTSSGQYAVLVANEGFAATTGPVTVTVDLPAGLTATAMSGPGWTCRVSTATCTGSSLAAGAQSGITLSVAVSRDAPESLSTLVRASGGGQVTASPANHYDTLGNGGSYVIPTYVRIH